LFIVSYKLQLSRDWHFPALIETRDCNYMPEVIVSLLILYKWQEPVFSADDTKCVAAL